MSNDSRSRLHLPSLSISGFRGIDNLDIPRLGRVTLLAGRNGIGKTTLLEAFRIYASRCESSVLDDILDRHDEIVASPARPEDDAADVDDSALFTRRGASGGGRIRIGSDDRAVSISKTGEHSASLGLNATGLSAKRKCGWIGPGPMNSDEVTRLWEDVALTDDEDRAVDALNMVLGGGVVRVAAMGVRSDRTGGDTRDVRANRRRIVVKSRDRDGPAPLRSLGDGATRLFGVALALAAHRDGYLLIDEAENGIHHSVHYDLWRMILQTAEENNVQVVATTHSFDCVRGFAYAMADAEESDGVLVRLERGGDRLRAVTYSGSQLKVAAEQDIEVR